MIQVAWVVFLFGEVEFLGDGTGDIGNIIVFLPHQLITINLLQDILYIVTLCLLHLVLGCKHAHDTSRAPLLFHLNTDLLLRWGGGQRTRASCSGQSYKLLLANLFFLRDGSAGFDTCTRNFSLRCFLQPCQRFSRSNTRSVSKLLRAVD